MLRVLGVAHRGDASGILRCDKALRSLPDGFESQIHWLDEHICDWRFGDDLPSMDEVRQFDVVYATRFYGLRYLPWVMEAAQHVRVVLDYDDLCDNAGSLRDAIHALTGFAHGVTGICPELTSYYADRVAVCDWQHGIDPTDPAWCQAVTPPERLRLFLGPTGATKEAADFIAGVLLPIAQEVDFEVDFPGDPEAATPLIWALGRERVITPGVLPFAEYMAHLASSTLCLVPFWGEIWGKGIPRLLQAAAMGVPCIYSPVPMARRFMRDSRGGCVIAEGNHNATWQGSVRMLLLHEEARRFVADRAHVHAMAHYTQAAQSAKLARFFESVVRPERGR